MWYRTLTQRLRPDADFHDFASATTEVAAELYGSTMQQVVRDAWIMVGIDPPRAGSRRTRRTRAVAAPLSRRRLGA